MSTTPVANLLQQVFETCPGVPIAAATSAYIRAARRFCNRSRWLQTLLLGATVAPVAGVGSATYNVGSDVYSEVFGIQGISLTESTGDTHPLTSGNATDWDQDDPFDVPQKYQYIPHSQVILHPTPDKVYSLSMGLVIQPKIGANAIDSRLLVHWSEALEHGALSYLLMLPKVAWSNPQRGLVELGFFNDDINSAKSDLAAGFNAGATPTGVLGPRSATARTKMSPI